MKTFFVILAFYLAYLAYGSFAGEDGISLNMYCSPKVKCTFQFTNKGHKDVFLLKRNTPLEGLVSPFIAVYSQTGRPLQYKGIYAYRKPLDKNNFVLLKAGKSISATVDITRAFSIDSDGMYTIEYTKPIQYVTKLISLDPYELQLRNAIVRQSGSIYLKDTHLLPKPQILEEKAVEKKDIITTQNNCQLTFTNGGTTAQRNDITTVHGYICDYVDDARDAVRNYNRYVLWFGTYTTARADKVKEVYDKIYNGLRSDTVTYNMNGPDCEYDWAAYTQHGARTVYLCSYVNNLSTIYCPNSDNISDNKESIMLHEWTHAYGYTKDHSYGVTNDQNLARNSPNLAIENADNLERYYCPATYE